MIAENSKKYIAEFTKAGDGISEVSTTMPVTDF